MLFSRALLALLFIAAGLNHFRSAELYLKMMPPGLPAPLELVYLSGIAEIAGGIGILPRQTRRFAGYGLLALLVAVFPANIYMSFVGTTPLGFESPRWIWHARLPLQFLLMWWVWRATQPQSSTKPL